MQFARKHQTRAATGELDEDTASSSVRVILPPAAIPVLTDTIVS